MILYVNCCVRSDSRTDRIARALLDKMGEYTELFLPAEDIRPLDEKLLAKRDELISAGSFDDPMLRFAVQFAEADKIVIAAPFWDGSFPSLLKVYIENIYAVGIVTRYGGDVSRRDFAGLTSLYTSQRRAGSISPISATATSKPSPRTASVSVRRGLSKPRCWI